MAILFHLLFVCLRKSSSDKNDKKISRVLQHCRFGWSPWSPLRFFVVMLLIMAPLAEPLRQALRARSNEHDEKATTSLFTIFWGTVLAGSLAFFVRGVTGDTDIVTETFKEENVSRWIQFYAPVLRRTPIILVHVGGTLFLSLLGAMVCHRENTGMIGWILLAFTYLQMIVIPWDQDSFAHLVSLNIVGMVTFQWYPGWISSPFSLTFPHAIPQCTASFH